MIGRRATAKGGFVGRIAADAGPDPLSRQFLAHRPRYHRCLGQPNHPALPLLGPRDAAGDGLITIVALDLPNRRQIQRYLVLAVHQDKVIQRLLLISYNGTRPRPDRLGRQVEVLADVSHTHQDIFQ